MVACGASSRSPESKEPSGIPGELGVRVIVGGTRFSRSSGCGGSPVTYFAEKARGKVLGGLASSRGVLLGAIVSPVMAFGLASCVLRDSSAGGDVAVLTGGCTPGC